LETTGEEGSEAQVTSADTDCWEAVEFNALNRTLEEIREIRMVPVREYDKNKIWARGDRIASLAQIRVQELEELKRRVEDSRRGLGTEHVAGITGGVDAEAASTGTSPTGEDQVETPLRPIVIIDGFILFLEPSLLLPNLQGAIKLFLPTSKATAKTRRFRRLEYMDPPSGSRFSAQGWKTEGYFENVVW